MSVWQPFTRGMTWTHDLKLDVVAFLQQNGRSDLIEHSLAVGAAAKALAEQFNVDPGQAEQSGWLHAIGAVVPEPEAATTARAYGLDVLPAEEASPVLLIQKLSARMAQDIFGVTERHILAALDCYATLKPGTLPLDRIVFLANHLAETTADAPYLPAVRDMLERLNSLDAAVMVLCDALWKEPENPLLTHPWFVDYCRLLGQT